MEENDDFRYIALKAFYMSRATDKNKQTEGFKKLIAISKEKNWIV